MNRKKIEPQGTNEDRREHEKGMDARNWQHLVRSTLSLVFVVAGSACDSGYKQIGGLDDGATSTTYGNDDGDGGEACTAQDIDVEADFEPFVDQSLTLICAANVEPADQGWIVLLTHCTDEEGQPVSDREVHLTGTDWPQPELADGDQPLHVVRYIHFSEGSGPRATGVILRTFGQGRLSLFAYRGTEFLIEPDALAPLWMSLDEAACSPGPVPCTPETLYQEFPVGFAVGYGDAFATVGSDMMVADLGIETGAGIVYDVLVGFAVTHECYDDGDFHELQLGIVAKTVSP
jgi:hypothetical protein